MSKVVLVVAALMVLTTSPSEISDNVTEWKEFVGELFEK